MANTNNLQLNLGLYGLGTLSWDPDGTDLAIENFQIGAGLIGSKPAQFPGDGEPVASLVNGTGGSSSGGGQSDQWANKVFTLTAGSTNLHNLNDPTSGLKNALGQPIQLVRVTALIVVVLNHDGSMVLRVGPQGQSNAWQGPWEGVGSDQYENVWWMMFKMNDQNNGLGVVTTGTANILPIKNPGASSVQYALFVVGNEST